MKASYHLTVTGDRIAKRTGTHSVAKDHINSAKATPHPPLLTIHTVGTGNPSRFNHAPISTVAPPPDAPTNLQTTVAGLTSVNISWTAPVSNGGKAITGYRIEWGRGQSPLGPYSNNTGSTATTATITQMSTNVLYHFGLWQSMRMAQVQHLTLSRPPLGSCPRCPNRTHCKPRWKNRH